MANERDPKVSQRYRELGAEEPPRALDESILAAARAATEKPHAPLVTPVGRHRWYFSLAAAAIIVLAVAVTMHVERDRPDPEMAVATAPAPAPAPDPKAQEEIPLKAPEQPKARSSQPQVERRMEQAPAAAPASPPSAARDQQESAGAAADSAPKPMASLIEAPERWLERIAQLRKEGRHEEADKELAEFRKRYPGYRIPEAMLEKVEKK
jgi:hypothetical protein